MEESSKRELLQQFSAYLDNGFVPESPNETMDMLRLFQELAGLKNEVRIESRQLKTALEDFRNAFLSLDSSQQKITALLQRDTPVEKEDSVRRIGPVDEGLIDLCDRVRSALEQRPPALSFFERLSGGARSRKWFAGYLEGQQILLTRIEGLLNMRGISAMEAEGKTFDPRIMKAEGFGSDSSRPAGIVLRELRKGFIQGERIIRPAEVIVNKGDSDG